MKILLYVHGSKLVDKILLKYNFLSFLGSPIFFYVFH